VKQLRDRATFPQDVRVDLYEVDGTDPATRKYTIQAFRRGTQVDISTGDRTLASAVRTYRRFIRKAEKGEYNR
jgi:hypothetical protein